MTPSSHGFEKVRQPIVMRRDTVLLQNDACVASMISSVQADVQNDLASPHARWLPVGEDKVHGLVEIAVRQIAHIGRVPVIDLSHTVGKRLELRHLFGPRCLKRVGDSLQVMAEDSVDHVYVVEDAEHDRCILVGQPVEILSDNIVEAEVGPSLHCYKLGVGLTEHVRSPSTADAATLKSGFCVANSSATGIIRASARMYILAS